jgi:eukaryotic-like serine/threonine-protein kinase
MNDATQPEVPAAPPADLSGKSFDDYRIIRRLGQGGMGAVYLADQVSLKRRVALKFLRPELSANPLSLKRFRAEAEAVARINHANIVQVYAIGETDGLHYMALEYVDGRNLRDLVVKKGPPDLPICLAIMRQVASALQRASEAGIVHRDIKPENILITRHVDVKVADFGLSRLLGPDQDLHLTQSGMTLGTPLYMSPEQVRGQPLDPRSDVYSFGVTCYYMLAGQPPFHGLTAIEVALKHCEAEPPPLQTLRPDLPAELCTFVHRLMHKDPAQRPQSGREILQQLAQNFRAPPIVDDPFVSLSLAEPLNSGVSPFAATQPMPAARNRWRTSAIFAGALVAALAVGAGIKLLHNAVAAPTVVTDDQPNLEIVSNHERMLLLAVEENTNPKPDKMREALQYHVRLGLLYLDQRRFDEAERYFDELQKRSNAPAQYTLLGYLGTAITLTYRDSAESTAKATRMFQDLRGKFPQYGMLLRNVALPPEDSINLRYWLAGALDRLAAPTGLLPPALERLRDEVKAKKPPSPAGKTQGNP